MTSFSHVPHVFKEYINVFCSFSITSNSFCLRLKSSVRKGRGLGAPPLHCMLILLPAEHVWINTVTMLHHVCVCLQSHSAH